MTTWKKGRAYLGECFERMSMPLSDFLTSLRTTNAAYVAPDDRININDTDKSMGVYRVIVSYHS